VKRITFFVAWAQGVLYDVGRGNMPISFNSILDIDCVCLREKIEECDENTQSAFCRKIDGNRLGIQDFRSMWEKQRRLINGQPVGPNDCEGIVSLKGVSMNLYNEENRETILEKYRITFRINRRKVMYAVFRFQEAAGKVRYSPKDGDTSHHDLFKADTFTIEHVQEIESGNIFGGNDGT
jgi:hypothetical protein